MANPEKITEKQLAAARKVMARYDVAFSILAQGDASAHDRGVQGQADRGRKAVGKVSGC
jgi:hypothetical protein